MGVARTPGLSKLTPGTLLDLVSFVSRQGEVVKMCLLFICEVMGPTPRSTTSLTTNERRERSVFFYLQLFQLGESLDGFGEGFEVVVVQISETNTDTCQENETE